MALEGGINRFLSFLGLSCIFVFFGDPTSRPCASAPQRPLMVTTASDGGLIGEEKSSEHSVVLRPVPTTRCALAAVIILLTFLEHFQAFCTKRFMCII